MILVYLIVALVIVLILRWWLNMPLRHTDKSFDDVSKAFGHWVKEMSVGASFYILNQEIGKELEFNIDSSGGNGKTIKWVYPKTSGDDSQFTKIVEILKKENIPHLVKGANQIIAKLPIPSELDDPLDTGFIRLVFEQLGGPQESPYTFYAVGKYDQGYIEELIKSMEKANNRKPGLLGKFLVRHSKKKLGKKVSPN